MTVYTTRDYVNLQSKANHTTIHILVNGTSDPRLSINLYPVPVVLVHGISNTLRKDSFNYTLQTTKDIILKHLTPMQFQKLEIMV